MGITVFKMVSLKFSIEIATNSAIKIETIKSVVPNCPISLLPMIR